MRIPLPSAININSCANELTNYTEMIHYTPLALLQYTLPMSYLRNDIKNSTNLGKDNLVYVKTLVRRGERIRFMRDVFTLE